MPAHPPSNAPVELQGYVTDPKLVGYQILTNYENTYWLRLVGRDAWVLYLVLRSFCHEGHRTCNPSIKLLMNILGLTDRRQLIGRIDENSSQKRVLPGLIDVLQAHNLVSAEMVGEGPFLRYVFHVNLTPPLLTDEQLAGLPQVLQKKHAQLLERVAEAARKLAELKTQKPENVKKTIVTKKSEDPKETAGSAPTTEAKSSAQGGVVQYHSRVVQYHPGSGTVPPKQYPVNNTQLTTTGTRESDNNNSSGRVKDKPDVVVALTGQGIGEKVAQRLASHYSHERISEKIEFLDYLLETEPEQVKRPSGWLRRAIEEDYGAPDGYESSEARAAKAAESQRQAEAINHAVEAQRRREEEKREERRQQEEARLSALQAQYGTTQDELDLWRQVLDEFKLSMPASTFHLYVADILLLSIRDGQALLGVPNPLVREWVENRLADRVRRTLSSYLSGQKVTVKFIDLVTAGATNRHVEENSQPSIEMG